MTGISIFSSARVAAGIAIAAAAACAAATAATVTMEPATAHASQAAIPGFVAHRNVIIVPRLHRASPPSSGECQSQLGIACYTPAQLRQAYQVGGLAARHIDGHGETIVVIDQFGSPTIGADVATFDRSTGMPAASLKVMQPVGSVPSFDSSNSDQVGWAVETTLDVEWTHVLAPGAKIVLVEVPDQSGLIYGLQYAIDHRLGDVISLSWGGAEQAEPGQQGLQDLDGTLFKTAAKKRITVVDATGDLGATGVQPDGDPYSYPVVNWPASDPNVVAVGGSTLHLNGSGSRTSADTVWNDTYNQSAQQLLTGTDGPSPLATGGGKSTVFGWPYYQAKVGSFTGWRRGIPDISMSGACSGAVDIYNSIPGQPAGWGAACGTSEAAPLFAGVVALADQAAGHPLGLINAALYQIGARQLPGIVPITSGNNTVAFVQDGSTVTVTGYSARDGYSMAAGLGTIDAKYLVPELAHPGAAPPAPRHKPKHGHKH